MFQKKLLIATHNQGKLALLKNFLSILPFELVSLDDLGITHDVEETGTTYEENARLKAQAYANMSGLLTLADDGGIEIDALDGAPGIYSARYAGPNKTDKQKVEFLLEKLKEVPEGKRQAQFVAVLALVDPDGAIKFYRRTMPGKIAFTPKGILRKGLPYRQVFIPEGFEKTLDELDDVSVMYTSHRQKAFQKFFEDVKF